MPKSAFLFPGQGAQSVGMGSEAATATDAGRQLFATAAEVLGYDLAQLCAEGPAEKLDRTDYSQPALFVCSLAAVEQLRTERPELVDGCDITAGLSLGEYTALVFAGAMSFEDGLRVVQKRGQAMQAAAEATESGMVAAIMLDPEKVEAVREAAREAGSIEIANYLCPGNTVLSGDAAAIARATELIEEHGGRAAPLTVAGAFHTDLMKPADDELAAALADVAIQTPRIPVLSNVDAQPHTDADSIRRTLVRQVLSPVRWEDSIRAMMAGGVEQFTEVGPGSVLRGLMKRIDRKAKFESVG